MKTLKFIGLVGVISGFTTIACGGYVEGDKDSLVDSGLAGDTGATDYAKDCKANNGTYVGGKVNSEGKAIGECYITSATDNTDGYDSVLFSGYHQMAQDCLAVGHATFVISILIGEHSTTGECRTAPTAYDGYAGASGAAGAAGAAGDGGYGGSAGAAGDGGYGGSAGATDGYCGENGTYLIAGAASVGECYYPPPHVGGAGGYAGSYGTPHVGGAGGYAGSYGTGGTPVGGAGGYAGSYGTAGAAGAAGSPSDISLLCQFACDVEVKGCGERALNSCATNCNLLSNIINCSAETAAYYLCSNLTLESPTDTTVLTCPTEDRPTILHVNNCSAEFSALAQCFNEQVAR